jgi:hypothetical protein
MPGYAHCTFCVALRSILALLAFACRIACASPAQADDGGIENVGGAARLMKDQGHIRMVAETVRARVSQKQIEVDCVFVMENHGPADTVLIGFPDRSDGPDGGYTPMRTFRSWVDGVEMKCDTLTDVDGGADGRQWDYWWTKRVPFAAGATRTIRDYYVAGPGYSVDGRQSFVYILETGASWRGKIGSADITVTLDGISPEWIQDSNPKPRVTGRQLHWSFRDFEPGSDDGSPADIRFSWWSPQKRVEWEMQRGE